MTSKRLNIILETNYLETIKVMVSANLGWSILPESMVDSTLVRHRLLGLDIKRPLGIVTRQHRTLSLSSSAMIELLREEREQQPGQHRSVTLLQRPAYIAIVDANSLTETSNASFIDTPGLSRAVRPEIPLRLWFDIGLDPVPERKCEQPVKSPGLVYYRHRQPRTGGDRR